MKIKILQSKVLITVKDICLIWEKECRGGQEGEEERVLSQVNCWEFAYQWLTMEMSKNLKDFKGLKCPGVCFCFCLWRSVCMYVCVLYACVLECV